ncbi:MAG: type II secretion system F family protein [Desulfurococcales archaeon]|nr:type II secretion system F family protein [Desulfurococcales archaeon]
MTTAREKELPRGRIYRKPRRRITVSEIIDYIAVNYFSGIASKLVKSFELEKAIEEAGIQIYPLLYAARVVASTIITAMLSAYFILIIAFLEISLVVKAIASLLLGLAPIAVFSFGLTYPATKKAARKNNVETELPFFAAYLAAMARGGVPVSKVIEKVASLKVFRAMRREAMLISRDVKILGKDPLEAIERNAMMHPSARYRDFMLGYTTTVRTGGDVVHYLEIRAQDIFNSRMAELRIIAERMSFYTELYITVAVILALAFYIFFTIATIFPAASAFGGTVQLLLFTFVALPSLTGLIIYMIHAAQPKNPIYIKSPYRGFLFIGLPMGFILLPFSIVTLNSILEGVELSYLGIVGYSLGLALTLLAMSIPPAIMYTAEKRKVKGMAEATSSFLRDLAEIRKTGLSPERSIIAIASRDYGPLNRVVKKLATALSLGLSVEEALRSALRGLRDWLLVANMRFLSDSIEYGGGGPEVLETLARYAHNLVELDRELKRRLRTYMVMPYMGAILVSAASIMVLGFAARTIETVGGPTPGAGSLSAEELARVALYLSVGAIFNSWLMGMVVGKIKDQSLAAGFTHSIILTLVSLMTIIVALRQIPLAGMTQ